MSCNQHGSKRCLRL